MNPTDFDLDLFFIRKYHHRKLVTKSIKPFLLHLATAGGIVSEHVYKNRVHDNIRCKIKNMPVNLKLNYILNPKLSKIIRSKKELYSNNSEVTFNEIAYMHDFIAYVQSGCFSFDRTNIHDSKSNEYHLVASPIIDDQYFETLGYIFGDKFHMSLSAGLINSANSKLIDGCSLSPDGICKISNDYDFYEIPPNINP